MSANCSSCSDSSACDTSCKLLWVTCPDHLELQLLIILGNFDDYASCIYKAFALLKGQMHGIFAADGELIGPNFAGGGFSDIMPLLMLWCR